MNKKDLIAYLCDLDNVTGEDNTALTRKQANAVVKFIRRCIMEDLCIDFYDVIDCKSVCVDIASVTGKDIHLEAFRVYAWNGDNPIKR